VNVDNHPAANLDDYFDAAIGAYQFEGGLYGLPWIGMPVMLYVNLNYLEEAGISEDEVNNWTWQDFQDACVRLTVDANGNPGDSADFNPQNVRRYGFSLVPGWPPVQQFIWQAGGDVIAENRTDVPIDSPQAVEGAQFVADLANEYNCTPQQSVISERGFGEMMDAGQVAMFMGGAADSFERAEGQNIKAFLLPQGPQNRDTWSYIAGMSINSATRNPDAVYEAFMDLSQAIQEWKVPSPRVSLATREGIIEAAPFKEVSADNIIANMENMRAPVIFPGYAEWVTIFGERYVDPLVRGTSDAQSLGEQVRPMLEDQLQRSLEQQR
jgi:multiple sugar transport system substrate-binding protein